MKSRLQRDDVPAMSADWQRAMMNRLLAAKGAAGGWGYRTGGAAAAEATALACMALGAQEIDPKQWHHGLQFLTQAQVESGGVAVLPQTHMPCWTTGLAVRAWTGRGGPTNSQFTSNITRAVDWLLATKGLKVPLRPDVYGHDTRLQGWSWVERTHSWIEPTAYGVLGLRAAGKSDHPRSRAAIALLRDRMFPNGGWNYGNTRVLGRALRPFPGTSGIVLTALAGEDDVATVEPSIGYLSRELRRIRSPMSLGWGLIGLTECGARPSEADAWLAESATCALAREANPLEDALLLLADSKLPPFSVAIRHTAGSGNDE